MFNDICLRRKVINVHNTFGYYLLFCVTFSTLHFSIMKLGVGIKFSLFSLLVTICHILLTKHLHKCWDNLRFKKSF